MFDMKLEGKKWHLPFKPKKRRAKNLVIPGEITAPKTADGDWCLEQKEYCKGEKAEADDENRLERG